MGSGQWTITAPNKPVTPAALPQCAEPSSLSLSANPHSKGNAPVTHKPLTFGWFLPTSGDSTNLGDPSARIPQSPELFDEIVEAVDNGGYQYMLLPVNAFCWEATVVSSYYVAKTKNLAPLIALRSGYMNPTLAAKMFATLDQMSGGRLCINLIAGINDDDTSGDGVHDSKEVRYEKMDEEVEIMKRFVGGRRTDWLSGEALSGRYGHGTHHLPETSSAVLPRRRFRAGARDISQTLNCAFVLGRSTEIDRGRR